MRYAFTDRLFTVVVAADSIEEFEAFIAQVDAAGTTAYAGEGVVNADLASMMDMLSEERYAGLKKAPLVFEHKADDDARKAFFDKYKIDIMKVNAARQKQANMLAVLDTDEYSPGAQENDGRSIEEVYGLDRHDPWDKRTDDEILNDQDGKADYNQKLSNGDITGNSWDGVRRKGKIIGTNPDGSPIREGADDDSAQVSDVSVTRNPDGSIKINHVMATKGTFSNKDGANKATPQFGQHAVPPVSKPVSSSRSIDDILKDAGGPSMDELLERDEDVTDDLSISGGGNATVFYKIEVHGKTLADAEPVLELEDFPAELAVTARNTGNGGSWYAFLRQSIAEEMGDAFNKAGWMFESYGVNAKGERLAPKGIEVVDPKNEGVMQPRPWNRLAAKIDALSIGEKNDLRDSIKGKEFIFSGSYDAHGNGTIVYITPKEFFTENNVLWGEALDIKHLLPRDLVEIEAGVYQTTGRDYNHVVFDLTSRGLTESVALQLYLNNR